VGVEYVYYLPTSENDVADKMKYNEYLDHPGNTHRAPRTYYLYKSSNDIATNIKTIQVWKKFCSTVSTVTLLPFKICFAILFFTVCVLMYSIVAVCVLFALLGKLCFSTRYLGLYKSKVLIPVFCLINTGAGLVYYFTGNICGEEQLPDFPICFLAFQLAASASVFFIVFIYIKKYTTDQLVLEEAIVPNSTIYPAPSAELQNKFSNSNSPQV
jgi:hypothetical protein